MEGTCDVSQRTGSRAAGSANSRIVIGDAVYETEGSQHSRAELEALVRHLGIADRVGFTGFVTRPEAALRSLDVVVHASTSPEPFGLVIVEAMATARAVVMSLAGGAAEIVTPGVDALGHVPGDVNGLAARITELAASLGIAGSARPRGAADRRAVIRSRTSRPRSRADLSSGAP